MNLLSRKSVLLEASCRRRPIPSPTNNSRSSLLSLLGISFLTLSAGVFPLVSTAHEEAAAGPARRSFPAALSLGSKGSKGGANEQTIHMLPTGYDPRFLTIPAGTTVVFENSATTDLWPASNIHPTHEIYPEFDPGRAMAPGQSWRFMFTEAGVWTYHDHLYPTVTGTITVAGSGAANGNVLLAFPLAAWLKGAVESAYATWWGQKHTLYAFDPGIPRNSEAVYTDSNALYSYIRVWGLPATMEHLTALSARLGSCHDAAHRAGRIAYELRGDNAFTACSAACHSGCYHGATEYFFREHGTDNLTQNLSTLCSTELNSFISHQCIHGIGHGLMAWTNYEIHDALQACDLLSRGRDSCYTGVFMENVVGSLGQDERGSDGHFTNYVSDDPQFPCTAVAERYTSACYFYQTSRMLQIFGANWPKVAAACLAAPERFHRHCFESMGRDVGGVYLQDPAGAIGACGSIADRTHRQHCLSGAVQNYFWEPAGQTAALAFCRQLATPSEKSACYDVIALRATVVLPTPAEKATFCQHVEPAWQTQCSTLLLP